jgi:hypothetical protein
MKTKIAMDALKTFGFGVLALWATGAAALDEVNPNDVASTSGGYVWRLAAGGDVIAAVPNPDNRGASLVLAPLEPALAAEGQLAGIGGTLSLPYGDRSRVQFGAGHQWVVAAPARAAPWCGNLAGLLVYSSSPSECQGSELDAREPLLSRNQASIGYATDRFDVSLGYGLTTGTASSPFSTNAVTPLGIDYLGLAGAFGRDASGQDVSLGGTWRIAPLTSLRVTASLGETSLREPLAPGWVDFDHAALGLGVSRGPFSGSVVGRVVRGPATSVAPAWGGLDIGVAWRTPWRGELSFGARNLLSTGPEPGLSNPAETELERDVSRTPYVQYKQDL